MNGKFDFVWMYCGRFAQGNEDNYETEAASKTAQTNTVKGEFYQRAKADKVGRQGRTPLRNPRGRIERGRRGHRGRCRDQGVVR